MSEPRTEAGKRLLGQVLGMRNTAPAVTAIEAEAVAQRNAELAAKVRDRRKRHEESQGAWPEAGHVCLECWQRWPCDFVKLLARGRVVSRCRPSDYPPYDRVAP